ncbi:MAG: protein kinase, partial [Nannocystaceae bacterium]|nr:protein kinase [Nannocystaceae bacterium]
MPCLDENQLLDLVAGELDAAQREAFERHLDGCARCSDELLALVGGVRAPTLGVGDRLGRYRLLRRLGKGGMGEVFAAHDEWLQREVAIKLLRAELHGVERDTLLHEARALAALQHPGIVRVFDVGTDDDGRCYFAMELIAGATLRRQLRGTLPPLATRLRWALQIGEALAAAHDVGVVHGDVKPDNVLISPAGDALLLDFGLARLRQAPHGVARWAGTPAYLAPEQHDGALADERSDQFAYAATVHELTWGSVAFAGRDLAQLRAAKSRALPLPPSPERTRGARVHRVVTRGLAPQPAARWPDVHAMVSALRAATAP